MPRPTKASKQAAANPQNQARLQIGAIPAGVQVAWKFIWCSGYDWICTACNQRHRVRAPLKDVPRQSYTCKKCSGVCELRFHHFDPTFADTGACGCPPGPQARALMSTAFEVGAGGGRGSAKTTTGFALSIRGNYEEFKAARDAGRDPRSVDVTYLAHPHYRFLILRKNSKDMQDCWKRAKEFYSMQPVPCDFNESSMTINFASGAQGILDHMATEDAYEKYQGQEFQFVWCEELTQIPKEELYQKITLSCRSSFPEIRQKLFATANPGGPGNGWFRERFIERAPEGEIYVDSVTGLTRTFIHSTVLDNPYFLRDGSMYVKQLQSIQDESLRKKWFLGDFDALEGVFFQEFRAVAMPGEPKSALHVIPQGSVELLPHWRRWVSMDWGFSHSAAVIWNCRASDQRIYTYREMVESRIGSRDWGVKIARASIPDLTGLEDAHLILYLSPDAFSKRDESGSIAEQIAAGIGDVLGKNAAFIMDFTDDEKLMPSDQAMESLKRRHQSLQSRTHITIQKASNERAAGWSTMRENLRWWPLVPEGDREPDPKIVQELLTQKGVSAYFEYLKKLEAYKDEVLPKWRILGPVIGPDGKATAGTGCPKLIKALQSLQHKPDTEDVLDEGMEAQDCGDAARYSLHRINEQPTSIPKPLAIAQAVAALGEGASGHSKYMTAVAMEQQLNQHAPGRGVFIPRRTGRHHRVAAGVR